MYQGELGVHVFPPPFSSNEVFDYRTFSRLIFYRALPVTLKSNWFFLVQPALACLGHDWFLTHDCLRQREKYLTRSSIQGTLMCQYVFQTSKQRTASPVAHRAIATFYKMESSRGLARDAHRFALRTAKLQLVPVLESIPLPCQVGVQYQDGPLRLRRWQSSSCRTVAHS